jgi:hypothetical protein
VTALPPQISAFAIIAGAMKSGTTALNLYLGEHPEICAYRGKEANFWTAPAVHDSCAAGDDGALLRRLDEYRRLWPAWDPTSHRMAMEASPRYSKVPVFANAAALLGRVAQASGASFKFFYLVRDPLAAIESLYTHLLTTPDDWVVEPLAYLREHGTTHPSFLTIYDYRRQLNAYLDAFPEESLLAIGAEELAESPTDVLGSCVEFLGLRTVEFGGEWPAVHTGAERIAGFFARHEVNRVGMTAADVAAWRLPESARAQIARLAADQAGYVREHHGIDTTRWTIA